MPMQAVPSLPDNCRPYVPLAAQPEMGASVDARTQVGTPAAPDAPLAPPIPALPVQRCAAVALAPASVRLAAPAAPRGHGLRRWLPTLGVGAGLLLLQHILLRRRTAPLSLAAQQIRLGDHVTTLVGGPLGPCMASLQQACSWGTSAAAFDAQVNALVRQGCVAPFLDTHYVGVHGPTQSETACMVETLNRLTFGSYSVELLKRQSFRSNLLHSGLAIACVAGVVAGFYAGLLFYTGMATTRPSPAPHPDAAAAATPS